MLEKEREMPKESVIAKARVFLMREMEGMFTLVRHRSQYCYLYGEQFADPDNCEACKQGKCVRRFEACLIGTDIHEIVHNAAKELN